MTTAQRDAISNPVDGLVVFNTTTNCLEFFIGSLWQAIGCGCAAAPASPTAGAHTSSPYQIIWDWNVAPTAGGYKWNTSNDYSMAIDLGNVTTYTQTGLTCNTSNTIYVWAYNACGNSTVLTLTQTTTGCPFVCGSVLTDSRDSQEYSTVQIGAQCWIAENLNYVAANSWCYADNSSNCTTYGRLYTWQAALSACPSGWHLPSDAEWTTLTTDLGGEPVAGGKMKSTTGWNSPNTDATNESGFSGLPGGARYDNGTFNAVGDDGIWWSSTENQATNAWYRNLNYGNGTADRNFSGKSFGFSCRCLRD
jgi:uncharacterized protein (TIGR02145 family)